MSGEVKIRPFDLRKDLDDAHQVFISGFHHLFWPIMDEADPKLCRDMVKVCATIGSRSLAAETDGRSVGILIGAAMPKWKYIRTGLMYAVFGFGHRAFWNKYNMSPFAKKHLRQLAIGYSPHVYKHPPIWPWAEIIVFAIQKDYRGKGIGIQLMDAFLDQVRKKGIQKASVSTDSEMSWDFYEKYGFQRKVAFPLTAYKLIMPEKTPEGYIYSIELKSEG